MSNAATRPIYRLPRHRIAAHRHRDPLADLDLRRPWPGVGAGSGSFAVLARYPRFVLSMALGSIVGTFVGGPPARRRPRRPTRAVARSDAVCREDLAAPIANAGRVGSRSFHLIFKSSPEV